jgi:DedD protein
MSSLSERDTEITLSTSKMLVLFFGLVAICALFFALGYSLGRKSEPALAMANAATPPETTTGTTKPAGNLSPASPMTFYKAVEQKQASPDLTSPATDTKSDTPSGTAASDQNPPASPSTTPPDTTTLPLSAYFVQVAAVSKQEDADALVDALKKKQYPAFVASTSTTDKLFHVQVGPFSDIKDAEAMRTRLVGDGYNPILKK